MEALLSQLSAALFAMWGLQCPAPEVVEVPGLERPGFYMRTEDNRNVIHLRAGMPDDMKRRVLVHELAHCGMYEEREKRGQPHPQSFDPREERQAQIIERSIMGRAE